MQPTSEELFCNINPWVPLLGLLKGQLARQLTNKMFVPNVY